MAEGESQLTGFGKLISVLLILGLIGGGVYLFTNANRPAPQPGPSGGSTTGGGSAAPLVEDVDLTGVTTVKEYKYVPAQRLKPVEGISGYKWDDKEKVLRFSYNVWAGWLPVIAANRGTKPNAESVFFKKHGFKVELVLMDEPDIARTAFVQGEVHTLWGTVDMMTLFAPSLMRDSRTAPRIVQQIDWSNGGDGIVVRKSIQSVKDLKGKSVTLAQNSPSQYYLTSLLLSAGLKPADVKVKYTATAFEAARAFVEDKSVDACVSWAPDIYNIADRVPGTRILSSTADANKLIADVYAVRADFAKDHPEIVEGLVAGIFEGMDFVKKHPEEACKWMADAFGLKFEEAMGMRGDAHSTNFAENEQFFLNASNPTNFERTWKNASFVYRELGQIDAPVPFDDVMDFSIIKKLKEAGTFKDHKDESVSTFTPANVSKLQLEAPILTQTIRINFFPNSANPYELARDPYGNVLQGKLYDPGVDATLEQVARLAGQFDRATVLVKGHTDSSMKGKAPYEAVKQLSQDRAQAVKQALVTKFKFDPNKFVIEGCAWDVPFSETDPNNHALNRRVEISVYQPEQK